MADIFLSYKKEERATAELVVAALEFVGYSVWWDDDLTPRNSWDAEIEREITAAKAVLVLWSPSAAAETSFVRREAGFALDHKKLVPAQIASCNLPLRFRDIQTVDLTSWDRSDLAHTGWLRTLSWIAPLVGRQPRGVSVPASESPAPDAAAAAARNAIGLIIANNSAVTSDLKNGYYVHLDSLKRNRSPRTKEYLSSQDFLDSYYELPHNFKDDGGDGLAIGYMEYMRFMLDLVLCGAITRAQLPAVFMRFFEEIPQTTCTITERVKQRMIGTLQDMIRKVPDLAL